MEREEESAGAAIQEDSGGVAFDDALIETFCQITSSSREEAAFFLESHQGDLNAAVSTFFDSGAAASAAPHSASVPRRSPSLSPSPSDSKSASLSPPRSRSPSPPASRAAYSLRSRQVIPSNRGGRAGGVRTLSDLNNMGRDESDDTDSDEPQEYYTGGEKSGMLVQDPSKGNDVETLFNQARRYGAVEGPMDHLRPSSSSRSFTGTGRLLTGETVSPAPQQPEVVNHTVTFWANGFSVDHGPLRRMDDPDNASFLESIRKSECPKELEPADGKAIVHCELVRRNENYPEQVKRQVAFKGVGRTLGSSSNMDNTTQEPTVAASSLSNAPLPSMGLIVDYTLPSTSIQLRLADGTRMVSRFNFHHTIHDVRAFIDASRPGGSRAYQLQTVGFPPKQLGDESQTIEQAGLASSVIIQKF